MPLLPATSSYISAIKKLATESPLDFSKLSIEDYRIMCALYQKDMAPVADNITIRECPVPVSGSAQIKAKIFETIGTENITKPTLLYIPGGGFIAYLNCHDSACSIISQQSGYRVIMIEPRLAPEYPAPIPLQDTCDAVIYILRHATEFFIDLNNVAIGGDSSGANLALSTLLRFKQDEAHAIYLRHIKHLILISGTYDLSMSVRNSRFSEYEKEDLFSNELFDYMFDNYLGAIRRDDPLVSPYFQDLTGLPATSLLVAEYDGVRSQTEALHIKLRDSGVTVDKTVIAGQTHSYLILRAAMGQGIDPAITVSEILTRCRQANL